MLFFNLQKDRFFDSLEKVLTLQKTKHPQKKNRVRFKISIKFW
jgi:hypothetical protein